MKLECSAEKFKEAVIQAEKITGKNLTLPILNSILFIAEGNNLKLRATNLSLGIEIRIPAKIEKEGIVAISGNSIAGVFSNITQNENVFFESEDGNLLLRTKKNKIKIKGQQTDDFPTIPKVDGFLFKIESKKFIEGIKSVYYSSSVSDIKPEISSVCVYGEGDHLFFVATDSFRLAEKKVKFKEATNITPVLIPFKNTSEIIRIFGDYTGDLSVCISKNQISISSEGIYLTSRIIDGIFPDYRQIIPKEFKTEAVVLKQDLVSALKLSNIFSDKFNQINLLISQKDKIFELSSQNNDIGENKTILDAAIKGEEVSLSFNYKYFLDCIPSITTDSIIVRPSNSSKPMVISPSGDSSFTYLIMPMNR